MYKFIVAIMVILSGCNISNKSVEVNTSTGLSGIPQVVYFASSETGYCFSNVRVWKEGKSQPFENCSIFKTNDGGRSWIKIIEYLDTSFSSIHTFYGDCIYILCKEKGGYRIVGFNYKHNKVVYKSSILPPISCLWIKGELLNYTTSRYPVSWYEMSLNLENNRHLGEIDGYFLSCESYKDGSYGVLSNKGKNTIVFLSNNTDPRPIDIPNFNPLELKIENDCIMIIGHDLINHKAMAVKYQIASGIYTTFAFDKFEIIDSLVGYDNKFFCLIGNTSGHLVKYQFAYYNNSLGNWQTIKLKNNTRCLPLAYIDGLCYLYGGPNSFQRIIIE